MPRCCTCTCPRLEMLVGATTARWQLIYARDFFYVVDRFLVGALGPVLWLLLLSANDNQFFDVQIARHFLHLPMVVWSLVSLAWLSWWLKNNRAGIDQEDRYFLFLTSFKFSS